MEERARDAAEAILLLPLVERFRELMRKYGVRSEFWDGQFGPSGEDEPPLAMLFNAIVDRGRLKAFYRGITDDDVYRVYKDHDRQ